MIKLVASLGEGRKALMLGLTAANLDLLPRDMPIVVRLAELDLDLADVAEIVLFSGETEQAMLADLAGAGLVGPNTTMQVDPRLG